MKSSDQRVISGYVNQLNNSTTTTQDAKQNGMTTIDTRCRHMPFGGCVSFMLIEVDCSDVLPASCYTCRILQPREHLEQAYVE